MVHKLQDENHRMESLMKQRVFELEKNVEQKEGSRCSLFKTSNYRLVVKSMTNCWRSIDCEDSKKTFDPGWKQQNPRWSIGRTVIGVWLIRAELK
jgi:hypothetical protein